MEDEGGGGAGTKPIWLKPSQTTVEKSDTAKQDRTILVVEDEQIVREYVLHLLEKFGYRVLLAEDGIRGLEVFRENILAVDLVLADLALPRKSGSKMVEEMREIKPNIRVLYMTAHADDCFEYPVGTDLREIIPKPSGFPKEFLERVKFELERK